MRIRNRTGKQLQVYSARIRLAWFRTAEERGSYGIARSEYYYWHKRWLESGKQLHSLYNVPKTSKTYKADMDAEITSLIVQLRLGLGYGVAVSRHGVGNVLRRTGLTAPKPRKVRHQRKPSDYQYTPGEVGQLDVKHWKRAAYQYDIVDCATRITYKRLYPGVNPAYTVDFLKHAVRFFAPAFTFRCIQTDNCLEFVYDQLPQTKHLNGRIERSHGVDKDRYKKLITNSHQKAELQAFLVEDCLDYNFYQPHSMLRMLTPVEYLAGIPGYENATLDTSILYLGPGPVTIQYY